MSDIYLKMPVDWLTDQKKREGIFFLTCWMDSRLVNSDICVEKPVGSLDGSKKNGTVFFFWPVGWIGDWPDLIYV